MKTRYFALLLPLLLSGCLLPQPDTPPISPVQPGTSVVKAPAGAVPQTDKSGAARTQPVAAPVSAGADVSTGAAVSTGAGTAEGPVANNSGSLVAQNASLSLSVQGSQVKAVRVLRSGGTVGDWQTLTDGKATLTLAPDSYQFELQLSDGRVLKVAHSVTLLAGDARSVSVTVSADASQATLSETVPLVPVPSPSASAAAAS